jgi:hypothetical protein
MHEIVHSLACSREDFGKKEIELGGDGATEQLTIDVGTF